jgi:hypothetical protein
VLGANRHVGQVGEEWHCTEVKRCGGQEKANNGVKMEAPRRCFSHFFLAGTEILDQKLWGIKHELIIFEIFG